MDVDDVKHLTSAQASTVLKMLRSKKDSIDKADAAAIDKADT